MRQVYVSSFQEQKNSPMASSHLVRQIRNDKRKQKGPLLCSTKTLLAVLTMGSIFTGVANAQPTNAGLPVNTFTQLPKAGTRDLQRSTRALQGTD
jgi:hypothetical protein